MDKSLLILGASKTEIEIVKCAKRMGIQTIVTDNNDNLDLSPAKKEADKYWNIDWSDISTLARECKKDHVNGVMAGFSERRVKCASELCKSLNLPFYSDGANLEVIFNKPSFISFCNECGITTAKQYHPEDVIAYPVIVKPGDNGGAKGIAVCHNDDELENAVKRAKLNSQTGSVEIEEYVQKADEIVVWYVIQDGICTYLTICDMHMKVINPNLPQIPFGFKFPSKYAPLFLEKYDKPFKRLIEKLGIKNGLFGCQCLVKGERIFPYDPTFRLDMAMVHQITDWFGAGNNLKMLINLSLGEEIDQLGKNPVTLNFNGIVFKFPIWITPGVIGFIEGVGDVQKLDFVISVFSNYDLGGISGTSSTFERLFCTITLYAENEADLEKKLLMIHRTITVRDSQGQNMIMDSDCHSLAWR